MNNTNNVKHYLDLPSCHTHTMTQVFIQHNSRIPLMVALLITPSFKSLDTEDEMHALAYTAMNNMLCRFYNLLKERAQNTTK